MAGDNIKGPHWVLLGIVLFASLMQLIRLLQLPDTVGGHMVQGTIQLLGLYGILTLCVTRLSAKRFATVAIPVIVVGSLWPTFYRGLSADSQEVVGLLTAVAVGIGVGGMLAIWIYQRRGQPGHAK
jgi:hypothetical protein